MTTYKLTTLSDVFEQVPTDRIEACLAEVAHGMKMARITQDLLQSSADAIQSGATVGLQWPDVCEWTDDNDPAMTLNFTEEKTGDMFTLATQAAG